MKKFLLLFLLLLVGVTGWYLLKPYDYQVNMRTPAIAGTAEQVLQTWVQAQDSSQLQHTGAEWVQQIHHSGTDYTFHWQLEDEAEGGTAIRVRVTDPQMDASGRLALLFAETRLEKDCKQLLSDYLLLLQDHLGTFRVVVNGKATLPPTFCACVTTETSQQGKAWGMMYNYPLLSGVLGEAGIPLNGRPFLTLRRWDRQQGELTFDFCYPIEKVAKLPEHPELFYREFPEQKALKATYNGNYITSDRAWYHLIREAEKQQLQHTGLPIEVFHNNPNMGSNEAQWTAEIFLPLGEK